MTQIKIIIVLMLLFGVVNVQAQSKKEVQKKYEELQSKNLKLEKSNVSLKAQVENLTERGERLEKELLIAKESVKAALAAKEIALKAKDAAIKSKEVALQAQIETLKSKEVLFAENSRMEEIFAKEVKGKSNLRRMSIAGRYYEEGDSDKGYIELFEDGTLYIEAGEKDEDSLLKSAGGTYKLRGNEITLVISIFTIPKAIKGTINGNQLIVISDTGETKVYIHK
jgi:cell division protein FtsB